MTAADAKLYVISLAQMNVLADNCNNTSYLVASAVKATAQKILEAWDRPSSAIVKLETDE